MLGVRELIQRELPPQAQTWVNQRLKFTHGYGVDDGPGERRGRGGPPAAHRPGRAAARRDPDHRARGLLRRARPSDYVVVRTTEAEFDYPRGDDNAETRLPAAAAASSIGRCCRGSPSPGSFRDSNLLISAPSATDSELLYRRTVRERVRADRAVPAARTPTRTWSSRTASSYWMLDAYTYTAAYPYSQPTFCSRAGSRRRRLAELHPQQRQGRRQRLRRLDHFYVADPTDPLIQTYAARLPRPVPAARRDAGRPARAPALPGGPVPIQADGT